MSGPVWGPGIERRRRGAARLFATGAPPDIVHHRVASPRWTLADLRIACLADPHVCGPGLTPEGLRGVVRTVTALQPDIVLFLGDLIIKGLFLGRFLPAETVAPILEGLAAPLGVHAILGNHDWGDDPLAVATKGADNGVVAALTAAGLPPLVNASRQIAHGGGSFRLVGFDSQQGHRDAKTAARKGGRHDPDAAFAEVPPGEPVILMAHEPDWFAGNDDRALLQLSGHTHGGQANLFGWRPMTPSLHGGRYAWGHHVRGGRHLVVSGGLGYTAVPLRIAQPPEITLVTLSHTDT